MTPIERLEDFFANILHKIQSEEESKKVVIDSNKETICLSINEIFKLTHVHASSTLRLFHHEHSTREYTLAEQIKILESSTFDFIFELLCFSRELLKLNRSVRGHTNFYETAKFTSIEKTHAEKTEEIYLPKARCLIVDDETVNIRILSNLLKKTAICDSDSIDQCINATETFTFLESNSQNIDIVFLDNHLGPTSLRGDEIIEKLNQLYPHLTFIFTTSDSSYRESYISLGFDGFLNKPFTGRNLKDTLADIYLDQVSTTSEKTKKWTLSHKK
jgi:CheY-like chemotaxis protein